MNKRGDLTGVIFLIASVGAFAIFLLIVGYVVPLISNELVTQIGISPEINNSLNVGISVAEHTLPTLWLIMFVGSMLGVFITSYFIDTHPVFVPAFVILLIVAILVAIPISNAYEQLSETAIFTSTSIQQTIVFFMMTNLPFLAFIIGLISMIVAYAKPGYGGTTFA